MTRGWRGRLAYQFAVTVVVAGITHLVAVLVIPGHGRMSAYALLSTQGGATTLETIPRRPGAPSHASFADPALSDAACLYDLRRGPVVVSLDVEADHFAVLSVHDRDGRVLAGITNSAGRHMALALATPAQRPNEATSRSMANVVIEGAEPQGFAMAEVLARAPSEQDEAAALASTLSCRLAPP